MQVAKILGVIGACFFLFSCQSGTPVSKLQEQLEPYPEYSIILEDMKEEGNFFTDYYHRYKLVYGETVEGSDSLTYRDELTDWYRVNKKEYQDSYNYLGMSLVSKTRDAGINNTPAPPGYQYVGNEKYGRWCTDSQGNSFWEFYGKFAFFSYLFGGLSRPVYANDFDDYRRYRGNRQPYFGRNKQFGTQGSYTKQTKKSFFERTKAREAARRSRFSDKFSKRFQRSKSSSMRRRSGGFGK